MSQMSVLTEVKMEEPNDYKEELKSELLPLDPNSNAYRLLNKEIERLEKGEPEGASSPQKTHPWLELHHDKPQSIKIQIRIPVKEHPKFNFVGKLLGPKGVTLRRLQEETGTKMSILGRGSMRDKAKEEECRKEGGKFAHLNQDLHLMLECFAEAVEGYGRISHALSELKKFLVPDFNDEIRAEQFEQMGYMNNGDKPGPGRGGFGGRGAPRGRGGPGAGPPTGPPRGGMAGRGAPPRGAPRGGPPPRGAPRGGPSRGAMGGPGRGRGVPPPAPAPPAYEDYGSSTGYDDGYSNTGSYNNSGGYREASYDQSYDQSGTQYFDYGHGAAAGSGSAYDYGDAGWSSTAPVKPERGRGKPAPFGQRPHPYGRGGY